MVRIAVVFALTEKMYTAESDEQMTSEFRLFFCFLNALENLFKTFDLKRNEK